MRTRLRRFLVTVGLLALLGGLTSTHFVAKQDPPVTVTGCVERDAAASAAIFKLIVPLPEGRTRIYQLNAPKDIDVPAAAGKTAEVSGSVTVEKRGGREIQVLAVKTFKVVSDRCQQP